MIRPLALILILLAACSEGPPAAKPPAGAAPSSDQFLDPAEAGNLLDVANGAAVVSRTAEITLEASAIQAIDGDLASGWGAPPDDVYQTMVFSLPAQARIEGLGVKTPPEDMVRINNLRIEVSSDGRTFAPVSEPALVTSKETQNFAVAPTAGQYLRVTITGAAGGLPILQSIQARGRFLAPITAPRIDGCWSINGLPSRFTETAGGVLGTAGSGDPIVFGGGVEGALYRFAWVRGPDRGFGAITLSPDGRHLSGIRWFEKAALSNFGGSWFGDRTDCSAPPAIAQAGAAGTFIRRGGSFPLYSLTFDERDQLVEARSGHGLDLVADLVRPAPAKRIALIAREFREQSSEANKRRAQARLDSLRAILQRRGIDTSRIAFEAAGSDQTDKAMKTLLLRVMNSVVEIAVK